MEENGILLPLLVGVLEITVLAAATDRYGSVILIAARGLPILAEASVPVVGVHGMSWRRFLGPVCVANLLIAVAYSYLGHYAQENEFLPAALALSVALPVAVTAMIRHRFKTTE